MPILCISPSPRTSALCFGLAVCLGSPGAAAYDGPAAAPSDAPLEVAPTDVPDAPPAPSPAPEEAGTEPNAPPASASPAAEPADPPAPTAPGPPQNAESEPTNAPEESTPTSAPAAPAPAAPAVPDRLSRGQKAGWWTVLAVAALGTTAGVLSGFAEREEDRALRLATRVDLATGSQPIYADVQEEYESILDRGQTFETTSIVFGSLAGAAAIAAITLFVVDAHRRHRGRSVRAWHPHRGAGIEVRF